MHEQNITNGSNGMTAWGVVSVIHPTGTEGRFTVITYDGFNKMSDVFNYLRYVPEDESNDTWNEVISKSKMNEILPNGFQYRIVYELVERIAN